MAAALHITPEDQAPRRRPVHCAPATPALDDATAWRLLDVAKALADPVRLRLVASCETTPAGSAPASWPRCSD